MKKIGEDMFKLNCEAVNARYGEGLAEEFRPLDYKYKYCIAPNLMQIIKTLDCWLYQCSEGDCPDDPLFKAINKINNLLCRLSVERSDQYEKAQWG